MRKIFKSDIIFIFSVLLLVVIMTINVTKMNKLYVDRIRQAEVNAARNACVMKESLGYDKIPDRTIEERVEFYELCRDLLEGDTLDLIRRVRDLPKK